MQHYPGRLSGLLLVFVSLFENNPSAMNPEEGGRVWKWQSKKCKALH